MWQPRQTLANNSSPLISTNLKPMLNAGPEAEDPALCAYALNDDSESAAEIVMAAQKFAFLGIIWTLPAQSHSENVASRFDYRITQPRDGVGSSYNGSLRPC